MAGGHASEVVIASEMASGCLLSEKEKTAAEDDVSNLADFLCSMRQRNAKYVQSLFLVSSMGDVYSCGEGDMGLGVETSDCCTGDAMRLDGDDLMARAMAACPRSELSTGGPKGCEDVDMCVLMRLLHGGGSRSSGSSQAAPAAIPPFAEIPSASGPQEALHCQIASLACYDQLDELFFTGSVRRAVRDPRTNRLFLLQSREEEGERVLVTLHHQPSGDLLLLDSCVGHLLALVCEGRHKRAGKQLVTGFCNYLADCGV